MFVTYVKDSLPAEVPTEAAWTFCDKYDGKQIQDSDGDQAFNPRIENVSNQTDEHHAESGENGRGGKRHKRVVLRQHAFDTILET